MKKVFLLLAITTMAFTACKKSDSPSPSTGSGSGNGGGNLNDSATYVITASSNHMYALFSGDFYAPGQPNTVMIEYNFTTPTSTHQALPITVTLKLKNSDSLAVNITAKNNVPSELSDSNPVWSTLNIKKNGATIFNSTKTIQSGTFIYNRYTINGH